MYWLLLILLALSVGLSLWLRIMYYRHTQTAAETRTSPLSMAIQELVGTAGGIYLAAITLTSFLKLELPEKVSLLRVELDPLALSAIAAAILQPVALRLYNKFVK
ncbi:MAG: hypothetical protein P4N41_21345 [Negativicutes bacterium]|nr:hypothetical protein [Negativicutes bacterium]